MIFDFDSGCEVTVETSAAIDRFELFAFRPGLEGPIGPFTDPVPGSTLPFSITAPLSDFCIKGRILIAAGYSQDELIVAMSA